MRRDVPKVNPYQEDASTINLIISAKNKCMVYATQTYVYLRITSFIGNVTKVNVCRQQIDVTLLLVIVQKTIHCFIV